MLIAKRGWFHNGRVGTAPRAPEVGLGLKLRSRQTPTPAFTKPHQGRRKATPTWSPRSTDVGRMSGIPDRLPRVAVGARAASTVASGDLRDDHDQDGNQGGCCADKRALSRAEEAQKRKSGLAEVVVEQVPDLDTGLPLFRVTRKPVPDRAK